MPGATAARPPLPAMLALCVVPVLLHLAIVATSRVRPGWPAEFGSVFRLGFVTVAAAGQWGIYGSLLLTFGLTLRPGHEPLITAMARKLHGPIAEELARYTRHVTIAWCGFFATQLTLSVLLFCFAPMVVWSFFVNILDIPLVAVMFAAEYAIRLRSLRDPPRHSLAMILNMVAESRNGGSAQCLADAVRPD